MSNFISCSKQRNALPQEYYGIHDDYLPTELHDESVAVEYSLPQTGREPPCFLLVVDLCVDKLDLEASFGIFCLLALHSW